MARQGLFDCENKSLGLTKWGLIIFNVAFWCLGVVSLGIGIWLYVTMNQYTVLTNGRYLLGSVFLIAVGFGVIIVGFLGIVAAIWESNIIATFFGLMILLAFLMYMTSGIWSLANQPYVGTSTEADLQVAMQQYETNTAYADGWNALQADLECCGIESSDEWSNFLRPPRPYPATCCADPSNCFSSTQVVYDSGCLDKLVDYENQQLNIMGPFGLAFGCFQIIGLLISMFFCITVRISKSTYYI